MLIIKKLQIFRAMFTYLFDTLLLLFPKANLSRTPRNVLIIRLDVIGDFVLWLDAAKEMRKLYPEHTHRITLLANTVWAPLAESLPYFDEVWPVEKPKFYQNMQYRWQLLRKIRHTSFDIAIQPTFSREFLFGDSVIRICGAKERIGSAGDCTHLRTWLKPISDLWYTKLIPAAANPLWELERNAEFIRGLGLKNFKAALPQLPISNPSPVIKSDYFVIFPGSFIPYKQWSMHNFCEIARRLHVASGWHVVVCGGPGEENLGVEFARDADFPFLNRIGTTSLMELAAIIADARIVIANDTSAIHIAAAVSTPAVCILGGGHYGRFMPYNIEVESDKPLPVAVIHQMDCFGCNWHCIYDVPPDHAKPCIEKITVDDVWKVVEASLYGMKPFKKNEQVVNNISR
jgi:ADP-heptose:LPS heptosyltransferase